MLQKALNKLQRVVLKLHTITLESIHFAQLNFFKVECTC